MKKTDIKAGRWYVMRPPGVHRSTVLDGEDGVLVKVVAIGPHTYTVGECGRRMIEPTDQHSNVTLHVKGKRRASKWNPALVDFEDIVAFRDVLMTRKEWETKHEAFEAERRRVNDAMAAHLASIEELKASLPVRVDDLSTRRSWNSHTQKYETARVVVSLDLEELKKLVPAKHRRTLDELHQLIETPREEVIC